MMTEDYVSFETAKLLKEKGFNEETEHEMWYVIKQFSTGCHWNYCTYKVGDITREYNDDCCISMPTHQMSMKWLREVHHIHISINPISEKGYNATIYDVTDFDDCGIISDTKSFFHVEEACEAAIKYCLKNLI